MPKLLLLQPPVQDFYNTDLRLQPIGLAYLKAAVRQDLPHWDVKILDLHQGWGKRSLPLPQDLIYLREYYAHPDRSPFSTFYHYYHFGAPWDRIGELVQKESPDVVGISSLFSPYYREALETAHWVKRVSQATVLLGGSHVSAEPETMLRDSAVDFVIRGEGERALTLFLREWESGGRHWDRVPNLGYKEGARLIFNPLEENDPPDQLPMPDLSDFPLNRYSHEGKPLSFLVTSRSCPHRCSFCSVHTTFGNVYRRNSVSRVLEEIRFRHAQGYRVLDFEDDNLSFYQEPMEQICHGILKSIPEGEIQLTAMNGISYLSLNQTLLRLMKRSGFSQLNLALVTSDRAVRESTKRPHTLEKYLEVVEQSIDLGFKVVSYQILGLPQETLTSMVQTLSVNARLPVLLGASPFYLTPASPLAKSWIGPKPDAFRARLTAMAVETQDFSREDLYTLLVTTRIFNFLKGLPISGTRNSLGNILFHGVEGLSPRQKIGVTLLKKILDNGELYAASGQEYLPLKKFRGDLFFQVLRETQVIKALSGGQLKLSI